MLETTPAGREEKGKREMASAYATTEYPLERNGIPLHLDSTVMEEVEPEKDILLLHGIGEFEISEPFHHNTWEQAAEDFQLKDVLDFLPEGSEVKIIGKGSHAVIVEKPYYHEFQDSVVKFLRKALNQ